MAEQRLKVRPTKIELIRLKRRLALSQRVERIVKDRLSILTMEFLQVARECAELRERLLEEFRKACGNLNWQAAELGDASFQFEILPRIRGLVVFYVGDEEFPPEANILFNEEIVNFLPLEDVAVLAGLIATRLSKSVITKGDGGAYQRA